MLFLATVGSKMPAALTGQCTPTEAEKKTLSWVGRALQSAGRGWNTIRIRLATKLKGPEKPGSEVEFIVETSSVTFWPSEDSKGQPKHGAVVARDDTTLSVEEFESGELIVLNISEDTAHAWGHHPFERKSANATKAIAQNREPPRLHADVKSVGDSVHDTVSHAMYMTMEHGSTLGGLTPKTERPSVREVSLASEPREPADLPADSATLKHSAMHEILRVTRTILPGARAWAYGHFAKQGTKPSGGKIPHRKAPGLTEPTLWAKKGLAAKIAFQGDVAKMAQENGLFARVRFGTVWDDQWKEWRMNSGTPDGLEHNIPEGNERSAKELRESYEAKHFAAMIKQKGLGTQLTSIDGCSDPPDAPTDPLLADPVDEAIQAALAYANRSKTCIICSDEEQKKLIPRNLTALHSVCGKFLSHPRFLAELAGQGFGFCDCEVAWDTAKTELEIRVIERLKKELEQTPKPNRGSRNAAMAVRLSRGGINLPGRTLSQWKKCKLTDPNARDIICKFMRLTSDVPKLEQRMHVNRDGGRWLNIKNLARQFEMEVPQSE